jgi:SAM-dependent methyltransferase
MDVTAFVLAKLPQVPARVLEVGCGRGDLAWALAAAGYDVLAIDPAAPEGPIFRATTLEELGDAGGFDAVVAVRSLHHVGDLGAALDKIAAVAPLLVLDEFAWDRFDAPTAEWYEGQRRVLEAAGRQPEGPPAAEWEREHAGLHGYDAIRAELDRRFREREFTWLPYLDRYLGGPSGAALEQTLIDTGMIRALGFRYVGERFGQASASTRSAAEPR